MSTPNDQPPFDALTVKDVPPGGLFWAALYASEGWYSSWLSNKKRIAHRARAVVLFDRIMSGRI